MIRPIPALALAFLLAATMVRAQEPYNGTPKTTIEGEDEKDEKWVVSMPIYAYVVPNDRDYVQPTLLADKGRLHLEARYNYEGIDTVSAWVGWNYAGGDEWAWRITPMAGVVVGDTRGVAPGYRGALGWKRFELYSEGEYLFATENSADSFFYNWSELTWSPFDAFRFGLVAQRTQLYKSDREIQRGFLVGFTLNRMQFTATVLNPDDEATIVAGLSFGI
jgi:hypothetical protein